MNVVVHGYNMDEDDAPPVEIRCTTCGASAVMGERGYSVHLDELNDWAQGHECLRNLRVT